MKTFLSLTIIFVMTVAKLELSSTATNRANHPRLISPTLQPKELFGTESQAAETSAMELAQVQT